MTREAYVRVCVMVLRTGAPSVEIVCGLEWRTGDETDNLRELVRFRIREAIGIGRAKAALTDDMKVAQLAESAIVHTWPDRAYFFEVCSTDEQHDWVQVYDPKGFRRAGDLTRAADVTKQVAFAEKLVDEIIADEQAAALSRIEWNAVVTAIRFRIAHHKHITPEEAEESEYLAARCEALARKAAP